MKKICSRCGKTVEYSKTCACRNGITYNRNVSEEKRKFYSSYAWRKLLNRKVREHPYCERCWSKWEIVTTENLQEHHIKSFKDYPELRLVEDNIAVLCRVCNLQVGDKSLKDW